MRTRVVLACSVVLCLVALDTAVAAASSGSVASWGHGTASPTAVSISDSSAVVSVQAGNSSAYALLTDGTVWAWGDNNKGQLGDGKTKNSPFVAQKVQFPAGTVIKSLGEGYDFGAAVDSTGQGWGWGNGAYGSICGAGGTTPSPIPALGTVSAVAGGGDHSIWLTSKGTVEACGTDKYGDLGDGKRHQSSKPVAVVGLTAVKEVSAGDLFSGALTTGGQVYMWGEGTDGQLGDGKFTSAPTPRHVTLPALATELYLGGSLASNGHTCALAGKPYCWGDDANGQLGDGGGTNRDTPLPVSTPKGVTYIAASGATTYALAAHGALWAWGANDAGQIGTGSRGGDVLAPVQVKSGVARVSATDTEVVILDSAT
jgi:alpha-tubulin suppressor-like RCC1 family protein